MATLPASDPYNCRNPIPRLTADYQDKTASNDEKLRLKTNCVESKKSEPIYKVLLVQSGRDSRTVLCQILKTC
jgi:hypothetical protein